MRVGYTVHPGFIDEEDNGTYTGLGVDYLNEIAKYTGWNYVYIKGSRTELAQKLQDGEIDFLAPIMNNHIAKPINTQELFRLLDSYLNG